MKNCLFTVFYVTQFHDCNDGRIYMSIKSVNKIDGDSYYLANTEVERSLDLVDLVVSLIPNTEPH